MSRKPLEDGGPAFPCVSPGGEQYPGISARDYFAAAALKGMLMSGVMREAFEAKAEAGEAKIKIVAAAYDWADGMLIKRSE